MRVVGKVLLATVRKDVRIQRWCSAAVFAAAFAAMFATILAAMYATILAASVFTIILGAGKAVLQARMDCSSMARCASTKQPVPHSRRRRGSLLHRKKLTTTSCLRGGAEDNTNNAIAMLRFVLVLYEASPRPVVYKQRTTPNETTITTLLPY